MRISRRFSDVELFGKIGWGRGRAGAFPAPRAARARAALYLAAQAQRAFQDQRRGGVGWAARGVPNVAGVLQDLERGPAVRSRRFDPRPAGVDTGRLKGSIDGRVTASGVEIFSPVEYASDVQEGGEKTIPITRTALRNLAAALRRARGRVRRQSGRVPRTLAGVNRLVEDRGLMSLGWLFGVARRDGAVTITVPARPFIALDPEDRPALARIAGDVVRAEQAGRLPT